MSIPIRSLTEIPVDCLIYWQNMTIIGGLFYELSFHSFNVFHVVFNLIPFNCTVDLWLCHVRSICPYHSKNITS